ncbi:MAG: hypothetical protein E7357_07895 [Clostridiales bacterium]|nr:hypothetical protein [Clostridiales bacterium]
MKQIIWSNWNHEPIDHLRRLGESRISIFTLGEWLPEWYERLHGEELIKKAAEMGVNTIYTHFFKGFGLIHEYDDMEKMREFVKIAHKYGVEVIGYIQLGTLNYETLLDEIPNLQEWITRDEYGKPLTYGEHYYRWRPCLESKEFIEYYKKVLLYGLEHVGLDGFHFDGARARECYCDKCLKAFREYLTEHIKNPRELVGLKHFNHVQIPPLSEDWDKKPDEIHDVLALYRGRFRHYQLHKAETELFDFIKANGGKYVLHNPGMLRDDFVGYCDPALNPKSCDFVFAENNKFIVRQNDKNVNQVLAYKVAERFGFKLFDAPWLHVGKKRMGDSDVVIPNEKPIIDRFLAQGMIYGGISGAPWFVRSKKTGSVVAMDDENHFHVVKHAFDYFKENGELYHAKSIAKVKLLYCTDTFYGFIKSSYMYFQSKAMWLSDNNVPYVLITDDEIDQTEEGDVIILPDYKYASNAQYDKLKKASERGVRILMLGEYGLCTENGKERDHKNKIRNLEGLQGVITDLPEDVKFKTTSENTLVDIKRNEKGNVTLHVLRIDNEGTLPSVGIDFKNVYVDTRAKPVAYSIDGDCSIKSYEITDEKVHIELKNLTTMVSIEFVK